MRVQEYTEHFENKDILRKKYQTYYSLAMCKDQHQLVLRLCFKLGFASLHYYSYKKGNKRKHLRKLTQVL